jgi:hypothetical protein
MKETGMLTILLATLTAPSAVAVISAYKALSLRVSLGSFGRRTHDFNEASL